MKKVILMLIPTLFLLVGCTSDNNENLYTIELENEPYEVCGTEIYFSNYAWGNELQISNIIETIVDTCNIDGMNMAKDIIESILYDDEYTIEDIRHKLEEAYDYINEY